MFELKNVVMLVFSVIAVASAAAVAFMRNIVHMAFALLFVFVGVLGIYVLLAADFIAVIQLVIYIGGILVLILFAVMFTTKIGDYKIVKTAMPKLAALVLVAAFGFVIWSTMKNSFFAGNQEGTYSTTTAAIGTMLLGEYLLPFEIVSLILILVLMGAMALARREVR